MFGRLKPIHAYVAALVAILAVAAPALVAIEGSALPAVGASASFWVLLLILIVAELRPVRIDHRVGDGSIVLGTMFAVAMLHLHGTLPTMLALVLATVVGDVLNRLGLLRTVFNAAMYALSVIAGGLALSLVQADPVEGSVASILGALVVGAVIFVTQTMLTAAAIALATQRSVVAILAADWRFNVSTMALMVSMAPAVVVIAAHALWLLPLLVGTVGLVYANVRRSLQREREALHDLLTDLPNRRYLELRARSTLRLAKREGRQAALMLLDLDGFKEINDTFGHHVGDEVLKVVGARLSGLARGADTVARLGGDEFAVLLADVPDEESAITAGERMATAVRDPIDVNGLPLSLDASVGVAIYPRDGSDTGALLVHADGAMYKSKRREAGTSAVSAAGDDRAPGRLALIAEFGQALPREELRLQWQPQVNVHGDIVGAEALVRWDHPFLGAVLPGVFMPLVEHTDLIGPVTLQVMEQAFEQLSRWVDQGTDLDIAINLGARNLHNSRFPHDVRTLLLASGVPPERVTMEITEHCLVQDPDRAAMVLQELHDLGVKISIDDFGTGFSSLTYLRALPVTELKIDRTFITDITDPAGEALVGSVIGLARGLSLEVVAEGVESRAHERIVFSLGCDRAQGFAISPPVSASELEALIHTPSLRASALPAPARARQPRPAATAPQDG